MRELFKLEINVTEVVELGGEAVNARMILFEGDCNCPDVFVGRVLNGGVDTQITKNGVTMLSARYMLEGVDCKGMPCRIFIENNGQASENGKLLTMPRIITSGSENIKWLEETVKQGEVVNDNGQLIIRFMGVL
ncbi:MAG: DUF3237 domain-containing protein [Lachnospiraceae bacterium]|nr:DUF3237 domain-containing protein [Lachnospiraceae bacterium]